MMIYWLRIGQCCFSISFRYKFRIHSVKLHMVRTNTGFSPLNKQAGEGVNTSSIETAYTGGKTSAPAC
jgi:hypothetical protein